MEETLRKIDMIKERTKVSYKEAKQALEQANGDVLEAIINIEENQKKNTWTEQITVTGTEVVDKLREIIRKGNVSRIKVKKGEYLILDIPVTVGAVGTALMPYITALGAAIAFVSKVTIEIERPNKESINLNEEMIDMVKMAENKAKEYVNPQSQNTEENKGFQENYDDQENYGNQENRND